MLKSSLFFSLFLMIDGPVLAHEKTNADFEKTLQIVRKNEVSKDWEALRKIAEELKESWPESSYAYSKIIYEICSKLNSARVERKDHRRFLQSLAVRSVESGKGPVHLTVRIAGFIQPDFDHRENNIRGEEWARSRRSITRTALAAFKRLEQEIDRYIDLEDLPYLNIAPPGGKYPSGVSPDSIEEPEIRKKYEAALEANAKKAERNSHQRDLHDLEKEFLRNLETNTVRAFSIEPVNIQEVKSDFKEYGIPQELTDRVVQKLEARALALSNRPLPPQMEIMEPGPPGTGPHHADLRLRKKVTFNLAAPKVEEMLERLRQHTGVALSRAYGIQNTYPATGSISVTEVPAWQVMDDLAAYERVEGRWETDGTGYRIVRNGNPVIIPEESAASHLWRNILIASAVALVLAFVGTLVFMKRRAKLANKKE